MNADLITAIAIDGAAARCALSPAERERCARLPTRGSRSDFRAGRLAAKRAATPFIGSPANRVMEILSDRCGPPGLTVIDRNGSRRVAPVELSISHRDGRAVAAAGPAGVRVGVDLEAAGAVPPSFARYFLTRAEMGLLACLDATVLWALKEAAWKALGLGRDVPFKALELCPCASGALRVVRVRDVPVRIHARLDEPWQGYHRAIVWLESAAA